MGVEAMNDTSKDASRPASADVFDRYGLRRIVNASGTETTKGASPVCKEALDAVVGLVPHSVDMLELQSVACHVIARAFGAEAACVVNCSAAGIATAVAACMTRCDLGRVEQLPDATGMKDEVVLQRGHNITYGGHVAQNITLVGAKVVEIGAATECGAYQLAHALTDRTAAALYVVSHHTVPSGLVDLQTFCAVCRERGVPVIVDGAAEPDPTIFLRAGADLVITSMHKAFAALTAATVAGRLDLVRACIYQEKGIGRPMKVGKEGVIAAIAAVERWCALDRPAIRNALEARLARGRDRLAQLPGVTASVEVDATSRLFSRLLLHIEPSRAGITAHDVSARLWEQRPSIAVRSLMADIGLLQVDLRRADDATTEYVVGSIERIVREASAAPAAAAPSPAPPNLADLAAQSLERFPLAPAPRR
jgi:L-seryl-tRNA(Ser) seleniumtransferase